MKKLYILTRLIKNNRSLQQCIIKNHNYQNIRYESTIGTKKWLDKLKFDEPTTLEVYKKPKIIINEEIASILHQHILRKDFNKCIDLIELYLFRTHNYIDYNLISLVLRAIIDHFKFQYKFKTYIKDEAFLLLGRLYNNLSQFKIKLDRNCANCFIYANVLKLDLDMDKVEQIYKENEVDYDIVTYTNLILGYGRIGDFKKIRSIYRYIKFQTQLTINNVTYSTIIVSCLNKNKLNLALTYYYQMLEEGVKPTNHIIGPLIIANLKLKQVDQALMLFNSLLNLNIQPDRLCMEKMVIGLVKNQHYEVSLKFLEQAVHYGYSLNPKFYLQLISCVQREADVLVTIWDFYLNTTIKLNQEVLLAFYSAFKLNKKGIADTILVSIQEQYKTTDL
ncbi:hypothetical protein K502DRAFT_322794 [Neoconidiobolus thromboides FSU 785]|nr:hypothetical protein K502DRAFT_322794 [Neoconidiobolus thromboides FSU 785]